MQHLPWDFATSFPSPLDDAVDAGLLGTDRLDYESIKALHGEHSAQAIDTLQKLDQVLDARRRGVDPATGKPPRTNASREKLRRLFQSEPVRLERTFENLLGVYEDAFGSVAADAFRKALRARHAGVEIVADGRDVNLGTVFEVERRTAHYLPAPRPLRAAVDAGHFGLTDTGKPVRPCADEIREITENHADKLIGLLHKRNRHRETTSTDTEVQAAIAAYAEDFGGKAAKQLEAYARRQLRLDGGNLR